MTIRTENLVTGLIVASAVAVAGANIHREFFRPAPATTGRGITAPTYLKDWKGILEAGTVIGDSAAPVKIIEFADLECPGCRTFYTKVHDLPPAMRSQIAIVFVHYPLSMHRFAMPAARAAECARGEGKFNSVVDVLFNKQDSLGLKSWAAYGAEAGVGDTASFARCAASIRSFPLVDAGRALGKRIGVTSTPTVIINGWRYSSPPYDSLAELVGSLSRGTR
jgi:protein-disulfide isomerase